MKYCDTCGYVEVAPTGACRRCGELVGPRRRSPTYHDPINVLIWVLLGICALALAGYGVLLWMASQFGE